MMDPATFKQCLLQGGDGLPPTEGSCLEFCPYDGFHHRLAVGCLDGTLQIFDAEISSGLKLVNRISPCLTSDVAPTMIRAIFWFDNGDDEDTTHRLVASDNLGRVYLIDAETGKVIWFVRTCDEKAELGINGLCQIGDHHVATGDDMGVINIWDIRTDYSTTTLENLLPEWMNFEFHEGDEQGRSYAIDSIVYVEAPPQSVRYSTKMFTGATLIASGGPHFAHFHLDIDGKIKAKSNEPDFAFSDPMDTDVGRICPTPNHEVVLCGSTDGMVSLWKWSHWVAPEARLELKQLSHTSTNEEDAQLFEVTDVFTYDDHCGLAACSDGSIRALTLFPLGDAGRIGEHFDAGAKVGSPDHTPCQAMALNYDYSLLATIGLNSRIQIMMLPTEVIEAACHQHRGELGPRVKRKKVLTENEHDLASEARGAKAGFFGAL